MANFDPSLSEASHVSYADNGTAFTVQWHDVQLKDHTVRGVKICGLTSMNNSESQFFNIDSTMDRS